MPEKALVRQLKGSFFISPLCFTYLILDIHIESALATTLLCGLSL